MLKIPKSRSSRRIKVKLPGGRVTIHYEKRKPKRAIDPHTKEILQGVPNLIPVKLRRLPKTKRRPNRPFGGVLSSSSMRERIIEKFVKKNYPLSIGRLVVKTAGRDAGKIGVIVNINDNKTILIDGQVRRRECNINHVETLDKEIKIKGSATHDTVVKEFKAMGIAIKERKIGEKKKIKGKNG